METHGRWPVVAALGAAPATAVAARRSEWRPLAALLWHQTEEWVWPGGFLPWINREVLGSQEDEFPIDRRLGFGINVIFGWGFSLAPLAAGRGAGPSAMLYASHLGNTALHVSWAMRHRRYDPGTVTAIATLTPVAVSGLRRLARDPDVSRQALRRGIAGGVAVSAVLVPSLKWRLRRRNRVEEPAR